MFGVEVPREILAMAALSAAMASCSMIMACAQEPTAYEVVKADCFAMQNLLHSALLLGFVTSAWRGDNVLGGYITVVAPRLMFCATLAVASVAASAGRVGPVLLATAIALAAGCMRLTPGFPQLTVSSMPTDKVAAAFRFHMNELTLAYLASMVLVVLLRIFFPTGPSVWESASSGTLRWVQPLVETYTLAMHVALIVGAGRACAANLDSKHFGAAGATGAMFVGGAGATACALCGDAVVLLTVGELDNCWAVVLGLAVNGVLWGRAAFRALRLLSNVKAVVGGIATAGVVRPSAVTLYSLAKLDHPGAWIAWVCCVMHGISFQFQAVLLVLLSPEPGVGFAAAANFAGHGAGIFVFNSIIIFHDKGAHVRLKRISIFACFAGGLSSGVHAVQLADASPAAAIMYICRAAAGAALGLAFLRLPDSVAMACPSEVCEVRQGVVLGTVAQTDDQEPALHPDSEHTIAETASHVKVAAHTGQDGNAVLAAADMASGGLLRAGLWWCSSSAVGIAFARVTVGAGLDPSGLLQTVSPDDALRVIAAPPTYLLMYHFGFLLFAFAAHGLSEALVPSIALALGFLIAWVLVSVVQILTFLVTQSPAHWLLTLLMSLGSLSATWLAFALKASWDERGRAAPVKGDTGDIWR